MDRPFYDDEPERRWTPLVLAALASLAIHALLYFRVSEMRFDVTARIPESLRETPARRFVNFERLSGDPQQRRSGEVADAGAAGEALGDAAAGSAPLPAAEMEALFEAPAVSFTAPPPQPSSANAAQFKNTPLHEIAHDAPVWQPRQEVVAIAKRLARDDAALMPRREIFAVERVPVAPDYVPAVPLDGSETVQIPLGAPESALAPRLPADTPATPSPPLESPAARVVTAPAATPAASLAPFGEKPGEISGYRHIDNRLDVSLAVFNPPGNDPRLYFRLEIHPGAETPLPVVGKDVVFVQDASRSLARERLHFCKEGLKEALGSVSAADRFNVVSFRDTATFCFVNGWASPTRENFERAVGFIDALESRGDTDLFSSLKALTALPRDPARPLIAIVVTDGKATTGITASTRIIGEFSKLNDDISLYVLGTHAKANAYLLDMLAFCNRGRQEIVRADRWSIPAAVKDIVESCSRPLLGRVVVNADIASGAEFFPLPSANLYAGEPLIYYGSCPRQTDEMTIQVRGEGGKAKIDCLFTLDFASAAMAGPDVKADWARRKMLSLVGDYARNPSGAKMSEMRAHAAATGEPIPYAGEL